MTVQKIGDLNGKWSILFKFVLAANSLLLPFVLSWVIWATNAIIRAEYRIQAKTQDRFTASMFIEVQDLLGIKNPTMTWLHSQDIKDIQRRHAPYK